MEVNLGNNFKRSFINAKSMLLLENCLVKVLSEELFHEKVIREITF